MIDRVIDRLVSTCTRKAPFAQHTVLPGLGRADRAFRDHADTLPLALALLALLALQQQRLTKVAEEHEGLLDDGELPLNTPAHVLIQQREHLMQRLRSSPLPRQSAPSSPEDEASVLTASK